MARIARGRCRVMWIQAKFIEPDPEVQRHFVESHGKAIAKALDPNSMPPLDVVEKPGHKDKYYVFSGQHRLYAVREVHGPDIEVPCNVWSGLSKAEKAKMVIIGEKKRNWNPVDKWRVRRVSRDPIVSDVDKILEKHGLVVSMASEPGVVSAINAVEQAYKQLGAEMLDASLSTISASWGKEREAYNGHIILGIAMVLAKHNGELNRKDLSKRLAKYVTPLQLIGKARGYRESVTATMPNAVATVVINLFNRGRTQTKIAHWGT